MNRKFAAFAAAGMVALAAGPALPAPGGKNNAAIEVLQNRVTVLENSFGILDQTVADILLSLTGIQDQLDSLDGRLTTVEEDILSPLFDIVVRSSTHLADPNGVIIYQGCEAGEMTLGGRLSTPNIGETWSVDAQRFDWSGDLDWATGWAASVTGPSDSDEYVQISAVCATALMLPSFGQNPLDPDP